MDYCAGVAALNRNDLQTAQAKSEEVGKLAQSAEQRHSALDAVLEREGHFAEATGRLRKALAMSPGDASAQLNLAGVYEQSGSPGNAVALYANAEEEALARKQQLPPGVLAACARMLSAAGRSEPATARMRQAVAGLPSNAQLRDALGRFYAQGHDWQRAEQQFSAAIQLRPDFATAHLHLGLVFEAEHKPGAVDELSKVYEQAPENAQLALMVGQAVADAGHDEQAVPILERARALEPRSSKAAYHRTDQRACRQACGCRGWHHFDAFPSLMYFSVQRWLVWFRIAASATVEGRAEHLYRSSRCFRWHAEADAANYLGCAVVRISSYVSQPTSFDTAGSLRSGRVSWGVWKTEFPTPLAHGE